MRVGVTVLVVLAACHSSAAPAVTIRLETSPNAGGCDVAWEASPADTSLVIQYRVGEYNPSDVNQVSWIDSGTFAGPWSVTWNHRISADIPVRWQLAGARLTEDNHHDIACGTSWQGS